MFLHGKYQKVILLSSLLLIVVGQAGIARAHQEFGNDGITEDVESRLVNRYLPTLQFVEGELFFPTSIEYHLSNSILKQRIGDTIVTVNNSPAISDIAILNDVEDNYFLDNKLISCEDIADDYDLWKDTQGYFIYARVKPDMNYIVVQYWLFYAYNNGPLNDHEGDWEMIEILLSPSEEPLYAAHSQHHAGERTSWANVEKTDESHPKVYVAKGSHANYFRPYQGNMGVESDIVAANGEIIYWSDLEVIILEERGADKLDGAQGWLDFAGRWGGLGGEAQELRGRNGALGPVYNQNGEKWQAPASWGLGLFAVDNRWFAMNWTVANFLLIYSVLIIMLAAWKVHGIIRLRRKGELKAGKILKTRACIGIVLGVLGFIAAAAALFLPWYVVTANIQTGPFSTQGDVEMLTVDGLRGVQVNLLDENEGLVQFFGLGIPFFIIFLAGVILGFLDLVGMKSAKQIGRKHVISGILTPIPVIVILLFMFQLASLIQVFAGAMWSGEVANELVTIADQLSSKPLLGSYYRIIGDYGTVRLSWGLGMGSYLFVAAAVVKIVGGSLARALFRETLYARPPLPPQPPPPQPPATKVLRVLRLRGTLHRLMLRHCGKE